MNDRNSSSIRIIRKYGRNKERISRKKEILEQLEEKKRDGYSIGKDYSALFSGQRSFSSSTENAAIHNVDFKSQINEEILDMELENLWISNLLAELEDLHKEILIKKYAEMHTWDALSYMVGLSVSRCQIHAKRALQILDELLEA